jgi:hypothetical protein
MIIAGCENNHNILGDGPLNDAGKGISEAYAWRVALIGAIRVVNDQSPNNAIADQLQKMIVDLV